jgi:hypothetical protein
MKKIIFTFVFVLSLAGLKAATSAVDTVTIFDPSVAADTVGIGAQGYSIVTLSGKPYLKIVVNGWSTNLTLNKDVTLPTGNLYTFNTLAATAKVALTPADTFKLKGRALFIQVFDSSKAAYSFSMGPQAPLTLQHVAGGNDSRGYTTHKIQIACQGMEGSWPAIIGDTVYLGKLISYQTQLPQVMANNYDTIKWVDDFDITDPTNDTVWDNNSKIQNVNKLVLGSATLAATGTFQGLWNSDYLYINAKIKDSNVEDYTHENPWNNDGFELYIDPNGLHFPGTRISFQHQIRFNYNSDTITGDPVNPLAIAKYGYPATSIGSLILQQYKTTAGYQIIIKMPWYTLWMGDTTHSKAQFQTDSRMFPLKRVGIRLVGKSAGCAERDSTQRLRPK